LPNELFKASLFLSFILDRPENEKVIQMLDDLDTICNALVLFIKEAIPFYALYQRLPLHTVPTAMQPIQLTFPSLFLLRI
jgi:hypothetical protein